MWKKDVNSFNGMTCQCVIIQHKWFPATKSNVKVGER